MDIPTIPGAWYTVATATTCQITDTATGTPLGAAVAGSCSFQAQGNFTTLSDDSALYSKSNFKAAPSFGSGSGGGTSSSALPSGYFAAEFLESDGIQYIDTGIKATPFTGAYLDFTSSYTTEVAELSPTPLGVGSDKVGPWYPPRMSKYWKYIYYSNGGDIIMLPTPPEAMPERAISSMNYKGDNIARLVSGYPFFGAQLSENDFVNDRSLYMFTLNRPAGVTPIYNLFGKIRFCQITENKDIVADFIAALDPQGVPGMFDKVRNQIFYNSGTGSFIVGFSIEQARKLSKLPATGGTLTISLPTGYESDSGVMSALETARSHGWTLTIQTYTPEDEAAVATFALRRIWVRRTADATGAHVAADGTRWHVDWCVDLLTPDGSKPDAHGYELFRSVDAAVEYWELIPYVDPETETLLTENTNNE